MQMRQIRQSVRDTEGGCDVRSSFVCAVCLSARMFPEERERK